MKFLLLFISMLSVILGSTDYVKVQVKPATLEIENGVPASFDVQLRASEGVHINAQPAITIKSETGGADLSVAELPKTGDYLDMDKPIKVRCKVGGLAPGLHRIDFVLGYTYCSDKEGWCRIGRDSSSIEIKVKK